MSFGPRRKEGLSTLTFHNRRSTPMSLWLEPWAEEVAIPPGSRMDIELRPVPTGRTADFEITDDLLVFFSPTGSCARVLIDGKEVETASATIPVPENQILTSRDMIHLVFDAFPAARPAGATVAEGVKKRLAEPMADGDLRLEPLAETHRAALKAACAQDSDIWAIYAISYDPEHFDASFDRLLARPDGQAFAILHDGSLAGMSAYIGIEPERGVVEIGNTYYVPALRGTGFNRRVKDLMIGRAIDCGFRRIEFRVDARNARSQAAMAKLGAVREGVIRAERITWTGHVRDTVLFSILAAEWRAG